MIESLHNKIEGRGVLLPIVIVALIALLAFVLFPPTFFYNIYTPSLQSLSQSLGEYGYAFILVLLGTFYLLCRVLNKPDHEDEALKRLERARVEQAAVVRLSTHPAIIEGNIAEAAKIVTEISARSLGVARASLWILSQDEQELECINLFELDLNKHSPGVTVKAADYPRYFAALVSGRTVDASNVLTDPRTSEFSAGYLKPLNITSMIDVPIRVRGKIVGVICNEAVKYPRNWSAEDIRFAAEISDQMAQAFYNLERRESAEALRQSEEMFRQMTENVHEVFWLSSINKDTVYYVSPAFEQIWGISCQSLIANPQMWLEAIHPDDLESVKKSIPGQVNSQYDVEYRIYQPAGTIRWIRDRAFPITDEAGNVYRVAGIAEDITDRKNEDIRRNEIESILQQSQKMEALGELAGGIAHDFNNILSSIIGYAELLQAGLNDRPQLTRNVDIILSGANRAKDLIKQILAYARKAERKVEIVTLASIIEEILKLIKVSLPPNISLNLIIKDECRVLADPSQLYQVFMNLCTNAVYAMKENGGELKVELNKIKDSDTKEFFGSVVVSDQGSGIPPSVVDRIFDPFFTTKPVGQGTGLGLSVVQGVIVNHGGEVKVRSEISSGTVFEVLLPLVGDKKDVVQFESLNSNRGSERIVLVDDEEMVASLGREILELNGYDVTTFTDPNEALIHIEGDPNYSLLITDLAMPIMSGEDLAKKVKKLVPNIKVILCTGYDPSIIEIKSSDKIVDTRINKPFSLKQFLSSVRSVLDETSPSFGVTECHPER